MNQLITAKILTPLGKILRQAPDRMLLGMDWKGIGTVLMSFLLTRVIVILVLYFSMAQFPVTSGQYLWRYNSNNLIADGLLRYDSAFYISIADHGYSDTWDGSNLWDAGFTIPIRNHGYNQKLVAFFPLYPLMIRLAGLITGNLVTSGLWVSNLSFLAALFYLYAFCKQEFNDETAGKVVFYLACTPAAFFFSAAYTESVCLLFLSAAFYFSRNQKWWQAGIAGALASATRPQGILVAVFILFESLWQQGFRFIPKPWSLKKQMDLIRKDFQLLPRAWKGLLAALLSTIGILLYMLYLKHFTGDPLAFLHVQESWGRNYGFDWIAKLVENTYKMHQGSGNILAGEIINIGSLVDTFFTIAYIPLVIIVLIRFRPSFGLFTLASFLIPLTSGRTMSMQRFVLLMLPCFFLLALWGKRQWVDRLIIGISLPLQAYLMILFAHWSWAG